MFAAAHGPSLSTTARSPATPGRQIETAVGPAEFRSRWNSPSRSPGSGKRGGVSCGPRVFCYNSSSTSTWASIGEAMSQFVGVVGSPNSERRTSSSAINSNAASGRSHNSGLRRGAPLRGAACRPASGRPCRRRASSTTHDSVGGRRAGASAVGRSSGALAVG